MASAQALALEEQAPNITRHNEGTWLSTDLTIGATEFKFLSPALTAE